jgi:hypothetical protein
MPDLSWRWTINAIAHPNGHRNLLRKAKLYDGHFSMFTHSTNDDGLIIKTLTAEIAALHVPSRHKKPHTARPEVQIFSF